MAIGILNPSMPQEQSVGKSRLRQINIRVPEDLAERIDTTAEALGLDGANFLRMLIRENLPAYERRAEEIRRQEPEKKKGGKS